MGITDIEVLLEPNKSLICSSLIYSLLQASINPLVCFSMRLNIDPQLDFHHSCNKAAERVDQKATTSANWSADGQSYSTMSESCGPFPGCVQYAACKLEPSVPCMFENIGEEETIFEASNLVTYYSLTDGRGKSECGRVRYYKTSKCGCCCEPTPTHISAQCLFPHQD